MCLSSKEPGNHNTPVYLLYLQPVSKDQMGEFHTGLIFSQSKRHQSNAYVKSAPYKPLSYEALLL